MNEQLRRVPAVSARQLATSAAAASAAATSSVDQPYAALQGCQGGTMTFPA